MFSLVLIGTLCFALVGCTNDSKGDPVNIGEKSKYIKNDDLVNISVKEETLTNSKTTLVNHNE